MSPEIFVQIVDNQQKAFVTGPGEPLVIGGTDSGEQVAVLEGRREGDDLPHYMVITAPNCETDSDLSIEEMWVGAKTVRHPTINPHTGNRTLITLADKRVLGMSRGTEQPQDNDSNLARLGGLAIRPVTAIFDYRQKLPVDAV